MGRNDHRKVINCQSLALFCILTLKNTCMRILAPKELQCPMPSSPSRRHSQHHSQHHSQLFLIISIDINGWRVAIFVMPIFLLKRKKGCNDRIVTAFPIIVHCLTAHQPPLSPALESKDLYCPPISLFAPSPKPGIFSPNKGPPAPRFLDDVFANRDFGLALFPPPFSMHSPTPNRPVLSRI